MAQKPLSYFKKNYSWVLDADKPTNGENEHPVGLDIFSPGSYQSLFTLVRHTQVSKNFSGYVDIIFNIL